jgi:2-oxoglutarate ferredoxin oxidoreductase subunit alpha
MSEKKFISGSQVAVQAAKDAGAQMMYGYPITPATEVFTGWIKNKQPYLQTEDEIAAGFAICGAVLAGQKAFTATSGPGHVLMQDGLSMAEAMRLPFVLIAAQRGGPSSGTVIYSQQEVTLACYGGNGEGLRLVYSPCGLEELYELTRRAFNESWKYRFPAIVLTDGYTLKTTAVVDLENLQKIENIPPHALVPEDKIIHWPNIYTFEEELFEELNSAKADFENIADEVASAETIEVEDAEIIIVAHGIVGSSTKEAIKQLRIDGFKVGMFRPITLRPFAKKQLDKVIGASQVKKVVVIESSMGQLARIVRDELAPEIDKSLVSLHYAGLGVETQEIINQIEKITL